MGRRRYSDTETRGHRTWRTQDTLLGKGEIGSRELGQRLIRRPNNGPLWTPVVHTMKFHAGSSHHRRPVVGDRARSGVIGHMGVNGPRDALSPNTCRLSPTTHAPLTTTISCVFTCRSSYVIQPGVQRG